MIKLRGWRTYNLQFQECDWAPAEIRTDYYAPRSGPWSVPRGVQDFIRISAQFCKF